MGLRSQTQEFYNKTNLEERGCFHILLPVNDRVKSKGFPTLSCKMKTSGLPSCFLMYLDIVDKASVYVLTKRCTLDEKYGNPAILSVSLKVLTGNSVVLYKVLG